MASNAIAGSYFCFHKLPLKASPVLFTENVIINEASGTVFARVEKLNDSTYLLKSGLQSVAFDVVDKSWGFTLTRIGTKPSSLECYNEEGERDIALQAQQEEITVAIHRIELAKAEKAAQAKAEREAQAKAEAEAKAKAYNQRRTADAETYILRLTEDNWRLPSTARNGMTATVRIHFFPSGEVELAEIIKSSDDMAFDRSVLQAIERVGQYCNPPIFNGRFQ